MCDICRHTPHLPRCPYADTPAYPHCPVCGACPETFYRDRHGAIVGCERCLNPVCWDEIREEAYVAEI